MCNSNSGIEIGIGFQWFLGMVESESKLNRRLKLQEGIGIEHHWPGIGIESESTFSGIAHH